MIYSARSLVWSLVLCVGATGAAHAQGEALPVPGYATVPNIPNARQTPDPAIHYKLAYVMNEAPPEQGEANPLFAQVARIVNTFAAYGVPKENREVAIVIYGPATEGIRTEESFMKAYGGKKNPNTEIIKSLRNAGVDLFVCGQSVAGRKIPASEIMPEVNLTLSASITLMNLQSKGYIRTN